MQNIVTLGEINDALKFTTVTAAQLAEMGFAALANKPICEALPQEEARRLRTAKLYPAESIGQIRVALAKRLAAPASCLHQIQEPAPATTEIITALWEAIGHHSAQVAETGEMSPGQKLLDAARAVEMAIPPAAIATLPKSDYLEGVNIPNLREALIFLGRENGVGEGEVGDKLAQYVNSVVSGVLSKKATLHEAPQAAPAAVAVPDAVRDALLQSEAALEVATARILKADPDHSISVTSEAKALVAVRAALAATPAATAQARGGELNQFLSAAKDAGITHLPMSFGEALRELEAATGTVVLPESDEQVKELMVLIGKYGSAVEANSTGNPSNYTLASDESAAYEAIKAKLRALLATGGQAQADKEMQLAMQEASSLAQSIFKRHYSDDEHYASGSVVWGLCDSLRGVISQIDNMTSGLVRAPQAQADARDAEQERWMEIGKAIERACIDQPDSTEIVISLERDAGTVTMFDPDGNEHDQFSHEDGFAGVVNAAIEAAIAAAKGE